MAAILSAALMCRWLGQQHNDAAAIRAGERIDAAVAAALTDPRARPRDIDGTASTREATDAVIKALQRRRRGLDGPSETSPTKRA